MKKEILFAGILLPILAVIMLPHTALAFSYSNSTTGDCNPSPCGTPIGGPDFGSGGSTTSTHHHHHHNNILPDPSDYQQGYRDGTAAYDKYANNVNNPGSGPVECPLINSEPNSQYCQGFDAAVRYQMSDY